MDTQSGKITQIVMRKGTLPTYHVIPMGEVEEIHEEYVLVSLFRADLDNLPRYEPRPDAEMLRSCIKLCWQRALRHFTGSSRSSTAAAYV